MTDHTDYVVFDVTVKGVFLFALRTWIVKSETYRHLVRRFWNHVFTWASVIFRLRANAARSADARYFCLWNRFSSSATCKGDQGTNHAITEFVIWRNCAPTGVAECVPECAWKTCAASFALAASGFDTGGLSDGQSGTPLLDGKRTQAFVRKKGSLLGPMSEQLGSVH